MDDREIDAMKTLCFVESAYLPIREDPDAADWRTVMNKSARWNGGLAEQDRLDAVSRARWLSDWQANVKQALRLYRTYVLGRGFGVEFSPRDKREKLTDRDREVQRRSSEVIDEFLESNAKAWSFEEFGVRTWRDGEQFTLKRNAEWPPQVRFIDTEDVNDPADPTSCGIRVKPDDPVTPIAYVQHDVEDSDPPQVHAADDVFHTKIDVDSNVRRGLTRFLSCIDVAKKFGAFVNNEVTHRNLQSSIVMQRKIKGGADTIAASLDNLKSSTTPYPERDMGREKIRPGTIINTNEGVEIEFKSPDSNFNDASPLGKLLIAQIAAATGWPYYAVSADSADSNFASALVQESPVVMMVLSEQRFFERALRPVVRWVYESAIAGGEFGGRKRDVRSFFDRYVIQFRFPSLVTRDKLKEAQSTNIFRMAGGISAAETSRRAEADPDQMQREIEEEMERGIVNTVAMQNPTPDDKTSEPSNSTGTNQGDPAKGHKDKL